MRRWIKGWIGAAFLALVLQPGKVLANENSVQVQTKVETDGWGGRVYGYRHQTWNPVHPLRDVSGISR